MPKARRMAQGGCQELERWKIMRFQLQINQGLFENYEDHNKSLGFDSNFKGNMNEQKQCDPIYILKA